ncbi:MAG: hypothetical protein MZU79_05680 [Anaerotruncus sp.]|nr:hypothetical protein [Anaerotruncus sp.]
MSRLSPGYPCGGQRRGRNAHNPYHPSRSVQNPAPAWMISSKTRSTRSIPFCFVNRVTIPMSGVRGPISKPEFGNQSLLVFLLF